MQWHKRHAIQIVAQLPEKREDALEVLHQAPTLEGMNVRAVATLTDIDGARLVFDIEVFDELGKVGQVSHER